jgi:transposase
MRREYPYACLTSRVRAPKTQAAPKGGTADEVARLRVELDALRLQQQVMRQALDAAFVAQTPQLGHLAEALAHLASAHAKESDERRSLSTRLARTEHERDEWRKMATLLQTELNRLRHGHRDASTERMDATTIQLCLEEVVRPLLLAAGYTPDEATAAARGEVPATVAPDAAPTPPAGGEPAAPAPPAPPARDKLGRKLTPHGRAAIPAHLPEETVEVPADPDVCKCVQCGAGFKSAGHKSTYRIAFRPAAYIRLHLLRPTFAKNCDCVLPAHVHQPEAYTPAVPELGPDRALCDTTLLAHVLVSRSADHLPLYRLEGIMQRVGLHIGRKTLVGWCKLGAELLAPIAAAHAQQAKADAFFIKIDATGVPVLAKGKVHRGTMWAHVTDKGDVVFDYCRQENGEHPVSFFEGYSGYAQADASSVFDKLFTDERIIEVGCWAHARRYFYRARLSDKGRAVAALTFIRELYRIDKQTRGLEPDARTLERRRQSEPVLAAFEAWVEAQSLLVLPRSPIAKAVNYARNHWLALCRFLEDGRLELDNNGCERAIKNIALGRKNWLHCGTDDAAARWAIVSSLVVTCRQLGIDPQEYLADVLGRVQGHPKARLVELTPRRWKQARDQKRSESLIAAAPD